MKISVARRVCLDTNFQRLYTDENLHSLRAYRQRLFVYLCALLLNPVPRSARARNSVHGRQAEITCLLHVLCVS
eukprot:6172631-Pleurochrysis_carterae.AAC.1